MNSTIGTSEVYVYVEMDVVPVKVDFGELMRDMHEKGVPYTHQALSIGKEWSTLQMWMKGAQPRFSSGLALLALHSRICGQQMTLKRLREAPALD